MSEAEPVVPYNDVLFEEWAIQHGVDAYEYPALHHSFRVAKLRSAELSQEFLFTKEVEATLGLENCRLIPNPRQKPDEPELPKVYLAPEGMAFEITTEMTEEEWNPRYDDAEDGFVGRYLEIEDLYILGNGTRRATIVVRGEPEPYAAQVEHWGDYNWVHGPAREDYIRLPSRQDSTKDGAWVWIPKPAGIEIFFSRNKIRAPYGTFTLKTIPHEQEERDTELYVADFSEVEQPALDEFTFIDEHPLLPTGIMPLPKEGGGASYVPNRLGQLVLPPMPDRDDWGDLWDSHGIMIKWNPTIHEDRFVRLDYRHGQGHANRQIKRFNSGQANGRMFMRGIAVCNFAGVAKLEEVMQTALSRERLSLKELLEEEKRH